MSLATEVRERVSSLPTGAYVRPSDFEGNRGAIDVALSRLSKGAGPLVRVHRGVYWRGLESRFGRGLPDPLESALCLAGQGAGPAEWSALRFLGLTTQVPTLPSIAVPGRVLVARGVKATKRNNTLRLSLEPTEIAVLEVLRDPWFRHIDGGLPALTSRVRELSNLGRVDPAQLKRVGECERRLTVRSRFTRLLDGLAHASAA